MPCPVISNDRVRLLKTTKSDTGRFNLIRSSSAGRRPRSFSTAGLVVLNEQIRCHGDEDEDGDAKRKLMRMRTQMHRKMKTARTSRYAAEGRDA